MVDSRAQGFRKSPSVERFCRAKGVCFGLSGQYLRTDATQLGGFYAKAVFWGREGQWQTKKY